MVDYTYTTCNVVIERPEKYIFILFWILPLKLSYFPQHSIMYVPAAWTIKVICAAFSCLWFYIQIIKIIDKKGFSEFPCYVLLVHCIVMFVSIFRY